MPSIVWTTSRVEISRERPSRMPGLDHRLGEERVVGGARARDGGDRVHLILGHLDDVADGAQHRAGAVEVLAAGVAPGAHPGDALVDGRRRVRHRAHDRHVRRRGGARSARS